MRSAHVAVGAAVVVALSGLSACAAKTGSAPVAGGSSTISGQTITLYNGQHVQTTQALVNAFEKQSGITVKVRSDDEDVLAEQIVQEGSKSPADVFFTENTPPLARLAGRGLLSTVDSTTLAAVPSTDNAVDRTWVGVSARVSGFVYNTDKLSAADLPRSVYDLADPRWKNKLAIAAGETDFAPIVTSIAAAKGDAAAIAWLKAVKANAGSHEAANNEALVADVDKGTSEIGLINSYYWYRLQDEVGIGKTHSRFAHLAAKDDGYLLNVSGAGVLKSSSHQAAAQALLAFLVSRSGETVIAQGDSYEYPLGASVPANAKVEPLSGLRPKDFSIAQVGDGKKAIALLQEAGLV